MRSCVTEGIAAELKCACQMHAIFSWTPTQISSPLLRNQHMWPPEYKTDDFRMFHLKVSFGCGRTKKSV